MLTHGKKNGVSLFLSCAIAVIISWCVSGCRIGNQESPAAPPASKDPYSGYYVTSPQSLNFLVTTSHTTQKAAPTTQIPTLIAQYMTNPVALILSDVTQNAAILTAPLNTKSALPISIGTDDSLNYSVVTSESPYWNDTNCLSRVELTETGMVTKDPTIASPTGTTYPISGRIQLKVQVVTQFSGNCIPTFQLIAKCYQDASQCGGTDSASNQALQAPIVTTFDPMIQAQALSVSDIPNIVNYAYEVEYQ
jgi:hypothetical protein